MEKLDKLKSEVDQTAGQIGVPSVKPDWKGPDAVSPIFEKLARFISMNHLQEMNTLTEYVLKKPCLNYN